MAMFSMLRTLRGRPGRDHTIPHADLVASSCMGSENASAFASCRSTYAAPSTCLRNFNPFSNSLSFIVILLLESFGPDAGVADHFAPFRDLGFDVRGEFLRRVPHGLEALVGEFLAQSALREDLHHALVQPRDRCAGRVRRREQPVPGGCFVSGHARLGE